MLNSLVLLRLLRKTQIRVQGPSPAPLLLAEQQEAFIQLLQVSVSQLSRGHSAGFPPPQLSTCTEVSTLEGT